MLKFEVLDTLIFEDDKIFLKSYHVQRSYEALLLQNTLNDLAQSGPNNTAISLIFVQNLYDQIEKNYAKQATPEHTVRLLLKNHGDFQVQVEVLKKSFFPLHPKLQIMRDLRQPSGLGPQNYKWNHRVFWDQALRLKPPHIDDFIFLNQNDEVTETSRCNLFFYDSKNQVAYTPPLDSGCINGVFRRYVLDQKTILLPDIQHQVKVLERALPVTEISEFQLYLANSVRKVLKAEVFV